MATICCSPPESVPAICLRRSFRFGNSVVLFFQQLRNLVSRAVDVSPKHQVLFDCHVGEQLAAFGNMADPKRYDFMCGQFAYVLAIELHRSALATHQPADHPQGCGFARAVGADQGYDFAPANGKREMEQDLKVAIARIDVVSSRSGVAPFVLIAQIPCISARDRPR